MSERLTTVVEPGETESLVPGSLTTKDLYLQVDGNDCYLGKTVDAARSKQRLVHQGDRGPLKVPERGERVFAHVPPGEPTKAVLTLDTRGFFFNPDPRSSINVDALFNKDGLVAFSQDIGTAAEQLASHEIADNVTVVVQAATDNTASVFAGDSSSQVVELQPGANLGLSVSNTDLIGLRAASGTQTVNVIGEADG